MAEAGSGKAMYPRHGWGALASDPWRQVGASGPEYREIMRRIWLRQGGSREILDQLIPPEPTVAQGRRR